MSALVVVAIAGSILLGLLVAIAVVGLLAAAIGPTPAERIERQQQRAERAVERDHHAARRAMNEAAGQSWRNLVD